MADRLRALAVLERLRRHEMEAQARELAVLRAQVARLESDRADLLRRLQDEACIVAIEAAPYVGAYIRSVRSEVARLDAALAHAAPEVAAQEEALSARFRDLRTVALALSRTREAAMEAQDRCDAAETDALSITRWSRRAGTSAPWQVPSVRK